MTRQVGGEPVYEAANLFRERCLRAGTSLLWPRESAWTESNLGRLHDTLVNHPGTGSGNFLEEWRAQLADQPADVHRVAADLLAFYYLFPAFGAGANSDKSTKVATVVGWKLSADPPDKRFLERIFDGLGVTGSRYLGQPSRQIEFYLAFSQRLRSLAVDPSDSDACKTLADHVSDLVPESREARHILLHLLFPDRFEPIISSAQRQLIGEAAAAAAGGSQDLDEAINRHQGFITRKRATAQRARVTRLRRVALVALALGVLALGVGLQRLSSLTRSTSPNPSNVGQVQAITVSPTPTSTPTPTPPPSPTSSPPSPTPSPKPSNVRSTPVVVPTVTPHPAPTPSPTPTPSPDAPPHPALVVGPSLGAAPLTVTADARDSTDTDSTPISHMVFDFGDGTVIDLYFASSANHTYNSPGNYTVSVRVIDTAGLSASTSAPVTVTAP